MSKRTEELKIRISPEDKERIKLKMEDAGVLNMSAYVRKMALDGICIRLEGKPYELPTQEHKVIVYDFEPRQEVQMAAEEQPPSVPYYPP